MDEDGWYATDQLFIDSKANEDRWLEGQLYCNSQASHSLSKCTSIIGYKTLAVHHWLPIETA